MISSSSHSVAEIINVEFIQDCQTNILEVVGEKLFLFGICMKIQNNKEMLFFNNETKAIMLVPLIRLPHHTKLSCEECLQTVDVHESTS